VEAIMSQDIAWAPGLPLQAEGFESDYYMKD
jgi:DNA polymerase